MRKSRRLFSKSSHRQIFSNMQPFMVIQHYEFFSITQEKWKTA